MNEFPFSEPLPNQCAHWLRAIVGLHFFPDANHRTAMTTLNTIFSLNDIERISWRNKRYRTAIFKSKLIRRFVVDVRFDNLWYEDELFQNWHRYFTEILYDIPEYEYPKPDYRDFETLIS
ncbi:MAG: prophage maintenance system killer protein [Natronomonas sp.]|jgi:prophage maintenance system killer protein